MDFTALQTLLFPAHDPLTTGLLALGLLVLCGLAGWLVTRRVLHHLLDAAILDHPNERSSHDIPTPRGGGWGILLVLFPAWITVMGLAGQPLEPALLLSAATLLAGVSWLDDIRNLPASQRLGVQLIAVLIGLFVLRDTGPVTQGWLPLWLDRLLVALAWLWFINLYNFMDGIDGLAGSETAAIGIGIGLLAIAAPTLAGAWPAMALLGASLAGAALGFLRHNWQPARLFMGDVGSVPLGYLIGWLLFALAGHGALSAAIILPLYFCADASLTLIRRLLRGEKPWQAHREHTYQRAVQAGRSHAGTVLIVSGCNLLLILLAVASLWLGWLMLIPAALVVALTLWWLPRPTATAPPVGRV